MIVEQMNTSTGAVLYLHHDQQGSTRLLTGSTGTVEGKCSYSDTRPAHSENQSCEFGSYVYGSNKMPLEQINNSTGTVTYLHHDQAGSTRLLTGSTGMRRRLRVRHVQKALAIVV